MEKVFICSELEEQKVPATGVHEWEQWLVENATCIEPGFKERYCKNCGDCESKTLPATGVHKWSDWSTTSGIYRSCCPTTTTKERHCKVCKTKESKSIFENHTTKNYGKWYITKKATALAEGKKARKCKICGHAQTKKIAKLKAKVTLKNKTISIKRKKSYTLKIKSKTYGDKVLKWTSSNKNIATVNSNGKVTGKKKGTVTITLKMKSGAKASCKIKVK